MTPPFICNATRTTSNDKSVSLASPNLQIKMIKKNGLVTNGGEDLVDLDDVPPDPTGQEGDDVY